MRKAENMNAPNIEGFAIGAAAGLVAFGVLLIVGEFELFPAAFMAGGVAAVAGLILGMPWGSDVAMPAPKPHVAAPVEGAPAPATSEAVAAPVQAQDVALAVPAAAPVAEASAGPVRLSGPRGGMADDLKEIEGIGPALEKLVNSLGFYHYDQIANWSDADVAVVDTEMKTFKGRITRDRWVVQARLIVAEGLDAFRERAKTNNY